jgi:hypothetical protein
MVWMPCILLDYILHLVEDDVDIYIYIYISLYLVEDDVNSFSIGMVSIACMKRLEISRRRRRRG